MISYERVKLGEVASIRGGKRLPTGRDFTAEETSHPYIRARDIGGGKVEIHDPVFLDEATAQKLARYTVNKSDVCLTIVGANVGEMGVVPPHLDGANLTENAVKIVTNAKADQTFLKYALLGEAALAQMKVLAGGAAQPKLGIYKIETIEIPCPPLPVQRRIAGILSAYDELMENSQRRIRLLEAMTRALYREWFVHFRFPGHRDVKFVETQFGRVPEGWVLPFINHVDFKEGPGLRNWQYRKEGLPFLNIRTLVDNDIDLSKVQFLDPEEVEEKYQHFLLREHDHVVSSSGTIGRILTIRTEHLPLMLNTSIIRMRPQGKRMGCWQLKHFMLADYFQNQAMSFATGAAQANFGPIHLKQMKIIAPDERTTAEYERLVVPMELAIMSLARKIQNLRRTRDLLLPRLLSAQVKLS